MTNRKNVDGRAGPKPITFGAAAKINRVWTGKNPNTFERKSRVFHLDSSGIQKKLKSSL